MKIPDFEDFTEKKSKNIVYHSDEILKKGEILYTEDSCLDPFYDDNDFYLYSDTDDLEDGEDISEEIYRIYLRIVDKGMTKLKYNKDSKYLIEENLLFLDLLKEKKVSLIEEFESLEEAEASFDSYRTVISKHSTDEYYLCYEYKKHLRDSPSLDDPDPMRNEEIELGFDILKMAKVYI